jgi:hypothetical protein
MITFEGNGFAGGYYVEEFGHKMLRRGWFGWA